MFAKNLRDAQQGVQMAGEVVDAISIFMLGKTQD
jgi:hypothetical protein